MENAEILQQATKPLLAWFRQNARELPWRCGGKPDPYHIWVSEIMLQQTRVEAVKPYYERFLAALPTVQALAEAEEGLLLKLWEGLGYYSRVRNMQKAAQQVMSGYGGEIPSGYQELLTLKGIGPYTAGAIASIAFGEPRPAVDGNVLRVMARLTADEADIAHPAAKRYWEETISSVLPRENPGEYNQALMELGATVCLPNGAPKCGACPLRPFCRAYQNGQTMLFPVKSGKSPRAEEELSVFFLVCDGRIAVRRRPDKGLLSKLWELPNCPKDSPQPAFLQEIGIFRAELAPMRRQTHIFTHIEWHMDCYYGTVFEKGASDLAWVTKEEAASDYALPSAFKKAWQEGLERMEGF